MKRIAIIAAATVALAAPAFARHTDGAWQVGNDSVHLVYNDLDTTTLAGRAELLKRVRTAALRVCTQPTAVEQNECVDAIAAGMTRPEIVQALAEHNATKLAAR
jgi:UrcA family protein